MTVPPADSPHRRRNALTGEWLTVSPQRTKRPWQGDEAEEIEATGVTYDRDCYLCPGNTRANGLVNPNYAGPWAFDNDFPALFNEIGPNEMGPEKASLDKTPLRRVVCSVANRCQADAESCVIAQITAKP